MARQLERNAWTYAGGGEVATVVLLEITDTLSMRV
jgi:hypothetical protein